MVQPLGSEDLSQADLIVGNQMEREDGAHRASSLMFTVLQAGSRLDEA